MLHRVSGLGVFLFLAFHILDVFLVAFGPDLFDRLLFFYHQFFFKLLIIFGLYLGVLYHALNGVRVILIDFWPGMTRWQARLWYIQMAVFLVAYIPSAWIMLSEMFR